MAAATQRITKTPGLCGGNAHIRGTRIPIWILHGYRLSGKDDGQLLQSYPSLTQEDLEAAWDYVNTHVVEIQEALQENEAGEAGFVE